MKEKKIARYKAGLWLTKDNKLIRMQGNMTSLSYKLTNYFLWLSVKEGRLDNLQITTAEIKNILKYKKTGLTDLLHEESDKIMKTIIEIKKDQSNDEWEKITLIPHMKYENGVITAKINPDLMPYITGLISNFTKTNYAMLNSCSYPAMRLAEVCSSWANAGYAFYSIDEWRYLLGATSPSYQAISQFRRRILHPAVKEVNERMNYTVTPIEIKKGRRVTHIKMIISSNADLQAEEGETINILPVAEPEVQPSLFDTPLSSMEEDVVERMITRYGYDQAMAIEAVKKYGVVYCQEQMETVRKAIKSAELAGKVIRSKGDYLNEALKKGYAQISKSLTKAKEAEFADAKDKELWDKQAREFYHGKPDEQAPPVAAAVLNEATEKEAEYEKELEKWKKMRGELRKELFTAMAEKDMDFSEFKKAMDDFEEAYPKPVSPSEQ